MFDVSPILNQLGAIAGSLMTIGGTVAVGYKSSRRFREYVRAFAAMPSRIAKIEHETNFNSGASMKDIVLRTEASVALATSRSAIVLNALGIGEFSTDREGRFISVSPEFCRIVKRPERDCLGWQWLDRLDEPCREETLELWQRAIRMGLPFHRRVQINQKSYVMTAGGPDASGGFFGLITLDNGDVRPAVV